MPYPKKGEQRNTGKTHFKKGVEPWNKVTPLKKVCLQCETVFYVRPSWNFIQHCSKSCAQKTQRKKISGAQSYLWKGGSLYWAKQQVKKYDDYTCQVCGLREPEIMEVDHIKPIALNPELKASLQNLMTLCPNCHARKTVDDRKNIKNFKSLTAD